MRPRWMGSPSSDGALAGVRSGSGCAAARWACWARRAARQTPLRQVRRQERDDGAQRLHAAGADSARPRWYRKVHGEDALHSPMKPRMPVGEKPRRLACHRRLAESHSVVVPSGVSDSSAIDSCRSINGCWVTFRTPLSGRSSEAMSANTSANVKARAGRAIDLFEPAIPV